MASRSELAEWEGVVPDDDQAVLAALARLQVLNTLLIAKALHERGKAGDVGEGGPRPRLCHDVSACDRAQNFAARDRQCSVSLVAERACYRPTLLTAYSACASVNPSP